jgi:hypothetical protein
MSLFLMARYKIILEIRSLDGKLFSSFESPPEDSACALTINEKVSKPN